MINKSKMSFPVISISDYKRGIHYRWEAEAHAYERDWLLRNGTRLPDKERRAYIDRYMTSTPLYVQMQAVQCAACGDDISTALLEGRDPFRCDEAIKSDIRALKARIKMLNKFDRGMRENEF